MLAADELPACLVRDVHAGSRAHLECAPDGDRRRLSFGLDRLRLVVVDRMPRRPEGGVVDENPVYRGSTLQSGSGVDDVAGGHALALGRARIERDERLAGGDPDP